MNDLSTILMAVLTIGLVFAYVFYGIPRRFARIKERMGVDRDKSNSPVPDLLNPRAVDSDPDAEPVFDDGELSRVNALRVSRGLHPLIELPAADSPESRSE